jgi:hypothetical protein
LVRPRTTLITPLVPVISICPLITAWFYAIMGHNINRVPLWQPFTPSR